MGKVIVLDRIYCLLADDFDWNHRRLGGVPVKKAPKVPKSRAKASGKPPQLSPELVKLAGYINPRALDAAQMVMVVAAALEPKDGAPPVLGDDARAGLVRILQEVTDILLGIKSEVAAALHTNTPE